MESGLSGCGEWRGSGSHISLVPVTQNFSENLYAIDRSSKTFWRGQRLRKFNKNSDCRFARFRKKNFWPPKPEIAIPVQIRISRVFAVLWSVERGADKRVDKSSFKARAVLFLVALWLRFNVCDVIATVARYCATMWHLKAGS